MTAILRHTPWTVSAISATTAAANYPASNLLRPSVGHSWRSTGTGTTNVDIDLGSARTAPILCVQGANAAAFGLSWGTAGYTDNVAADPEDAWLDRHGRRKTSIAFGGSVRYIRIIFGGTPPDGGAGYFEVGAIYVMSSTLSLPEAPLIPSDATVRYPQTRIDLPNGLAMRFDRGVPRQQLSLRFRGARTTDLDQLTRLTRLGVCWLDLGDTSSPELQWPVRHLEDTAGRNFARPLQDEATIVLREEA